MEIDEPGGQFVDCLDICIVCEDANAEKRLSDALATNLTTNLSAFHCNYLLKCETNLNKKIKTVLSGNGREYLENSLKGRHYNIHKRCFDRYNKSYLDRKTPKKRKKDDPARITRSRCSITEMFEQLCMYCGKPGKEDSKHPSRSSPLHAAAGTKISANYVDEFTKNVRMMATNLGEIRLLNLLGQDVRSSELYYHNNCHSMFKRRYEKATTNGDDYENSALKDFVENSDNETFDIHELESIFLETLVKRGKVVKSHITRFACWLKNANIGLTVVQSTEHGKYTVMKTNSIREIIPDSDWIQLLRKVVEPIRDEILELHALEKTGMSDLCIDPPLLPFKKLSVLITYLCYGNPDFSDLPLPLDTICQQIILNTKKTYQRQSVKSIRHNRDKECHRIQYATIKLYSVIRCKSLIHLLFQHGMILSYDRILSFLDELSQTVIVLFRDSDNKSFLLHYVKGYLQFL